VQYPRRAGATCCDADGPLLTAPCALRVVAVLLFVMLPSQVLAIVVAVRGADDRVAVGRLHT
jgi:hypothetical protein